jgi:hypothetical protein
MGHSYVWSVTESVALTTIHEALIQVLREQPNNYLPIKDLIYQMNRVAKKKRFHRQNKHNLAIKYLNDKFGSFENFVDDYAFYAILERNQNTYVYFLEHNYSEDLCKPRITKDKEWIFVETDDY